MDSNNAKEIHRNKTGFSVPTPWKVPGLNPRSVVKSLLSQAEAPESEGVASHTRNLFWIISHLIIILDMMYMVYCREGAV